MLADRHWQQGAYSVEVVPALVGDAPFTAALKLDDADDALVPAKGRHEGSAARCTLPGHAMRLAMSREHRPCL